MPTHPLPLNQTATVSSAGTADDLGAGLDKSMVKAVEKAIVDSNLGLSPATEGRCWAANPRTQRRAPQGTGEGRA